MQCLYCETGEVKGDTRDLHFPYRRHMIVVEQAQGVYCDTCEDGIFSGRKDSASAKAFVKED
jgi:YgiT-type zinc finger domain-containing protein